MIMRAIPFISILPFMLSCTAWPEFVETADDIFTDNAIKIEVQKEAMQNSKDLVITIDMTDKGSFR